MHATPVHLSPIFNSPTSVLSVTSRKNEGSTDQQPMLITRVYRSNDPRSERFLASANHFYSLSTLYPPPSC